jgi:nitroreductase
MEQLATERRSIRRYRSDDIPEHEILAILRIASRAPSPWNLQPWRFVVVRDPEAKRQLRDAAFGQAQVTAAPAVIVLCSDMADTLARLDEIQHPAWPPERQAKSRNGIMAYFSNLTPEQTHQWGRAIANIALGYLLLAAEAFSLGSSPMLGFDATKVKEQLELPEHAEIAALVALGYPDEYGIEPHRFPVESLTRFV